MMQPNLQDLFEEQKQAFLCRERPPSLAERKARLFALEQALKRYRHELAAAISADFGHRSKAETLLIEIFGCIDEIRHTRSRLRRWMKRQRVSTSLTMWPAGSEIHYQPKGVVGVMGAFNYPVYLTISPLVGALAAGNCVMLKPSELTPKSAEVLKKLIEETFDPTEVTVVCGGLELSEAFAALPFDHLVFTGSTRVGKLVMAQAAENLTPLTLELGGRSPTIIADDYSIKPAANEIAHTKLLNAGQTCLAPNHVYVPREKQAELIEAIKQSMMKLYRQMQDNPDYSWVINEQTCQRLSSLLEQAKEQGAEMISVFPEQPETTVAQSCFPPVLVWNCPAEADLLQQEIFGPILPIIAYDDLGEVIQAVNAGDRPLALYLFSDKPAVVDRVLQQTVSGGVTLNSCMWHASQHDLPLGGIGASGLGRYHGFDGFESFSHKKSVFKTRRFKTTWFMQPPFGLLTEWIIGTLIHKFPRRESLKL